MKLGDDIKRRLEPVSLAGGGLIGYFDCQSETFYPLESLKTGISVNPNEIDLSETNGESNAD